jgi:hypothetical protein
MKFKLLLTFSLFAVLAVTLVYAQGLRVNAKIPFAFVTSGKTLPAGQYEFLPNSDDPMKVTGAGKNAGVLVPVLTRLGAAIHTTKQDSHIVFDKVGEVYTLSEVWIPGSDGWLLFSTKGKHEHRTVDVPR